MQMLRSRTNWHLLGAETKRFTKSVVVCSYFEVRLIVRNHRRSTSAVMRLQMRR